MPYYVVTARYGCMRSLDEFVTDDGSMRRRDFVVLKTPRGTEIGDILVGPRIVPEGRAPREYPPVLRRATGEDLEARKQIEVEASVEEFKTCRRMIAELSLPMRLVSVEHLFGGEKLVFYFTADGRVDFRQLVRELARTFRTRIEMRQIGARDEARLLGDVGHCGRSLCCQTFLRELEPVTMRMARSQKATLDPSKISGACGRLMCCLRYEDETYRELKRELPPAGDVYELPLGRAVVTGHAILARRVHLETDKGKRLTLRAEELQGLEPIERREVRARGDDRARARRRRRGRRSEAGPEGEDG